MDCEVQSRRVMKKAQIHSLPIARVRRSCSGSFSLGFFHSKHWIAAQSSALVVCQSLCEWECLLFAQFKSNLVFGVVAVLLHTQTNAALTRLCPMLLGWLRDAEYVWKALACLTQMNSFRLSNVFICISRFISSISSTTDDVVFFPSVHTLTPHSHTHAYIFNSLQQIEPNRSYPISHSLSVRLRVCVFVLRSHEALHSSGSSALRKAHSTHTRRNEKDERECESKTHFPLSSSIRPCRTSIAFLATPL